MEKKLGTRKDILDFEQQTIPQLPNSVYQVLANSTAQYTNQKALRFFLSGEHYQHSVDWTYSEFLGQVQATANMFRDLGIGDTDVVTYILPNLPETLFTVYGGETAGIVNAVNPLLDPEHIIDIMTAADSKVLVTLAPFPNTDLWAKASQIIAKVPSLKTVLTVDLGKYARISGEKPTTDADVTLLDFHETVEKYPKDKLTFQRDIQPSDIASYFHTGGTTGRPKIAQHTNENEVFNAWIINKILGLTESKQLFCGLPWFHVNGVIVTGLTPLMGGHTIILGSIGGYRGEGVIPNFWKIVEHYKVSFFSAVPTILQMLLTVPQQGEDISSMDYVLCGAAPLSVKLFNDFEKATGIKIIEGYGFTEGTCANSANPINGERKVGSIGLAAPHHHMKIVIVDENKKYVRDAEKDEIGNIVARGKNVFPGYKEAIHNENAFVDDGTNQWYNTGDLGRMDADGYFWITGRKKELIIRGGHNIDPKSIEEPLSQHPAVAAVAAVARPDKRVGELPVAYIQLKPNQSVTKEELLSFAEVNIHERAAIPKALNFIDELPLTAVGKIFKPALSRMEVKEVYEAELSALDSISSCTIEVIQDNKKGMLAQIKATTNGEVDLQQIVNEVLGDYTVKFELV